MNVTLPLWAEWTLAVLLVISGISALLASWGVLRLKDFFQRMHPPALASTIGAWGVALASILYFSALKSTPVLHAWLMSRAELRMRDGPALLQEDAATSTPMLPLLTLERLTFRFVGAGFVLLTATLAAGWLFGEQLYGPAHVGWRWTHKNVFTLLSWIVFAALLLGHWRLGWRGRRAVRMLNVGAALLLLGYVGSRFVLEIILGRAT